MKRLLGRLVGGLRVREGTPGVSLNAEQEDVSVFKRRGPTAKEGALGGMGIGCVCESNKTTGLGPLTCLVKMCPWMLEF